MDAKSGANGTAKDSKIGSHPKLRILLPSVMDFRHLYEATNKSILTKTKAVGIKGMTVCMIVISLMIFYIQTPATFLISLQNPTPPNQ
jgi:hypothetical protein